MRLRNLTNSPYPVPLKDGTQFIIPAFEAADVDLSDGYPLDPGFWAVEEGNESEVEASEPDPEDSEDGEEASDEEADAEGDEEAADEDEEVAEEAPAPTTSTRKRRNRRR